MPGIKYLKINMNLNFSLFADCDTWPLDGILGSVDAAICYQPISLTPTRHQHGEPQFWLDQSHSLS